VAVAVAVAVFYYRSETTGVTHCENRLRTG